jgi:hypothetical protein
MNTGSGGTWNPSGWFQAAYKEAGPDGPLQAHGGTRGGVGCGPKSRWRWACGPAGQSGVCAETM